MRKQAQPFPLPQVKTALATDMAMPPIHPASLSTPHVNAPKPEQPVIAHAEGAWHVLEEAVVGLAHRGKNLPCQDAAVAVLRPHLALVVADGAGSSVVSEIGAQAVVTGTVRLLETLDKSLAELIDAPAEPAAENARTMGLLVVKHAMGLLKDLAMMHRREVRDFRCTLLMMVAGQRRILWVKVGDGALVVERLRHDTRQDAMPLMWTSECVTVGDVGKGEFANLTQFLDAVTPQDVQTGLLDATNISGLAAMSDGAAEKLVSNDGSTVAGRILALLAQLRADRLKRTALTKMFYEEAFCEGSTGDDRSIALAAREVSVPKKIPTTTTATVITTTTTSAQVPEPVATAVFETPAKTEAPTEDKDSAARDVHQAPQTDCTVASINNAPASPNDTQYTNKLLTWLMALFSRFRMIKR